MSHVLLNAAQRTAAGLAIFAVVAAASPAAAAEPGTVVTRDCLHGFGYDHDFRYGRTYDGAYGDGYFGGNAAGYGSRSRHGYRDSGCVETRHELGNPYVIHVAPPQGERAVAEAAEHERLWRSRCRPVIRQDAYGMRRYHYAAPGCDYGKYE
jgi:hypothetical protein